MDRSVLHSFPTFPKTLWKDLEESKGLQIVQLSMHYAYMSMDKNPLPLKLQSFLHKFLWPLSITLDHDFCKKNCIYTRGIRTLDFSRKTTNAVLSDLQIADVVKWFFKKLQIRSSRDLHNLWICLVSILAQQLYGILPQDFLWNFV